MTVGFRRFASSIWTLIAYRIDGNAAIRCSYLAAPSASPPLPYPNHFGSPSAGKCCAGETVMGMWMCGAGWWMGGDCRV